MATSARVPDKPSLDGIGEKWALTWEDQGVFRFDRTRTRERDLLDRHPAADGERLAAHGLGVRLHADRHHRALPADAGPRGLLPDGVGRQRPPHRAARAELLRRALRPAPRRTTPTSTPPEKPRQGRRSPISRPNFIELCEQLAARGRAGLRGAVAPARPLGRLDADVHDDRRRARTRVSQRAFLRNLARGEAYQAEAPTLWDVDFRTAVAQAELEDRELPGAYHALRFHRADGSGDILIDTTRPELLAACVAVVAHPDDERYQPLFGTEVVDAAVRRARARRRAPPRRSREGHRHRDDLHVRRHHRRRVVARAAAADARDHRRRRSHARRSRPPASPTAAPSAYAEIAGKNVKQAQKIVVELLARVRRARRRAAPDHAPGEVLRAGRPAARDRHVAAVVHPQRRSRPRAARRVPRSSGASCAGTRRTCARATTPGSRGSTPTGSSAGSATSACRSRSGTALDADGEPVYDDPILARRGRLAGRPVDRRARRLHAPTSAASRTASSPTPTSWTRGRRRRSRRRS